MKKCLTITMAVFSLVLMLAGSGFAITGSIWEINNYNFGNPGAIDNVPGTPALATFTINEINYTTPGSGTVTYTQFLTSGGATLIWDNQASTTFGGTSLVTNGTNTSLFQFKGTSFFPASFNINHDDGVVLYLKSGSTTTTINFDTPVSPTVTPILLSTYGLTAGNYDFTLNYGAWNGYPEVLQVPTQAAVPEPSTLPLIGSGFIGLAAFGRRKFRK